MDIGQVAELLSGFAAFMTIGLAMAELNSRSKAKKAEESIGIYADYLNLIQQTEYIVRTANSLAEKSSELSAEEIKAYAKTHMVGDELISSIQVLEKKCIRNLGSDKKNVDISKQIIDLLGAMTNILIAVNTFYQAILDDENYLSDHRLIKKRYQYISDSYEEIKEQINAVKSFFHNRVKKSKFSSNSYFVFLIVAFIAFFILCIIL